MLAQLMQTIPRDIQMNIMDNIITMNSVVGNVRRGANLITTRVYSHAAIDGQLAWNKKKTGVSVNDLLCTLDSIRALEIGQVHAIDHCMVLLQDFMRQLDSVKNFKYSMLYGDLASFIVTFGLYQDYAISKSRIKNTLPIATTAEVVNVDNETKCVENAVLDGKCDYTNYRENLFKTTAQYNFSPPAGKKYVRTAAAILYGMRGDFKGKEIAIIKCNDGIIIMPKWVITDKPGYGKRPLLSWSTSVDDTDRMYCYLQDMYVACSKHCKPVSDTVSIFDPNHAEEFKRLYHLGKDLTEKLKTTPGAPRKRPRKNNRGPLNDVTRCHKF